MTNSKSKTIKIFPDGYTAVTPWIISPSTGKMIEFLKAVFDARDGYGPTPAFLNIYVADIDSVFPEVS